MQTQTAVPPSATFSLTLGQVVKGNCPPAMKDAVCDFSYNWDFSKNMGLAHLLSVDGTPVNITLHPIGIAGMLGFMSDMTPTPIEVKGETVVLYRVILDVYLANDERTAALMLGEDGSCIIATENWDNQHAAGLHSA